MKLELFPSLNINVLFDLQSEPFCNAAGDVQKSGGMCLFFFFFYFFLHGRDHYLLNQCPMTSFVFIYRAMSFLLKLTKSQIKVDILLNYKLKELFAY